MKAQLQIGESIMVMIIIVIIAVIGLVFYLQYARAEYDIKYKEFEELNTLETAQVISKLYEYRCAKPGVTDLCIDIHKAVTLAKLRETDPGLVNDYYLDTFKDSKVTLRVIYPYEAEYVLYWTNATNVQSTRRLDMPVPVHNSTSDEVAFGILTIERYFRAAQ